MCEGKELRCCFAYHTKRSVLMELVQFRAHNGVFFIQLIGALEFETSAALAIMTNWIKKDQTINKVVIDLSKATIIDSTNLGLIAQLGLYASQNHEHLPVLSPGITPSVKDTLSRLELNQFYRWIHEDESFDYLQRKLIRFLGPQEEPEKQICERAIEAHELLMSLSETNKTEFRSVIAGLHIEKALLKAEEHEDLHADIYVGARLQELEVNQPWNETTPRQNLH